jgi:hypothetical protein
MAKLGPEVPLHFTAFHPDYKMLDTPHTRAVTLTRAREIARTAGLLYVYTGNVHDEAGGGTPRRLVVACIHDYSFIYGFRAESARIESCAVRITGAVEFDQRCSSLVPRGICCRRPNCDTGNSRVSAGIGVHIYQVMPKSVE